MSAEVRGINDIQLLRQRSDECSWASLGTAANILTMGSNCLTSSVREECESIARSIVGDDWSDREVMTMACHPTILQMWAVRRGLGLLVYDAHPRVGSWASGTLATIPGRVGRSEMKGVGIARVPIETRGIGYHMLTYWHDDSGVRYWDPNGCGGGCVSADGRSLKGPIIMWMQLVRLELGVEP